MTFLVDRIDNKASLFYDIVNQKSKGVFSYETLLRS